ncbi:MAG: hypothetical protein AB1765_07845 [Candidatus Hydrogenedentota bacterium]
MSIIYEALKKKEKTLESLPPSLSREKKESNKRVILYGIISCLIFILILVCCIAFLSFYLGRKVEKVQIAEVEPKIAKEPVVETKYFDYIIDIPETETKIVKEPIVEPNVNVSPPPDAVDKYIELKEEGNFIKCEDILLEAISENPKNNKYRMELIRYYLELERFKEAKVLVDDLIKRGFQGYETEAMKRRLSGEDLGGKFFEFPGAIISNIQGKITFNNKPDILDKLSQGDKVSIIDDGEIEFEIFSGRYRVEGPAEFALEKISKAGEGLSRKCELIIKLDKGRIKTKIPPFGSSLDVEVVLSFGVLKTNSATFCVEAFLNKEAELIIGVVYGHSRFFEKTTKAGIIDLPQGMYTIYKTAGSGGSVRRIDEDLKLGFIF